MRFTIVGIPSEDESSPLEEEPEPPRWSQSPNLIWPEDRAWYVHSEYDFDSTVVGGSRALIDALLASPDLEVWEVDGEVSLTEDADKLNPAPDPPAGANEPKDPKVLTREVCDTHLEWMSGTIAAVTTERSVLEIEVEIESGPNWTIEAAHSNWAVDEARQLAGAAVERAKVDPDTGALRLQLAGGSFEIVPLPWEPGDPPSWRVQISGVPIVVRHGPELLFEFPDED